MDPGKHTFRFETAGYPPVTEVALVKEGERARVFNVTFDVAGGTTVTPPTPPPPGRRDPPDTKREHTAYPWIVVGVGAVVLSVGAVIYLTTPDRPSNCNESTQKCTRIEGQSEADFRKDQERAGTADSQPVLGLGVGAAGAALVVGGLVWHFLEPTDPAPASQGTTKWRVLPWTTGQSSGLTFGGAF